MNLLGTNFRLHNKRLNPGWDSVDPAPDFTSPIVPSDVETVRLPAAASGFAISVFDKIPLRGAPTLSKVTITRGNKHSLHDPAYGPERGAQFIIEQAQI